MNVQTRFSRAIIAWGSVIFAAIIVININFIVERIYPLTHLDLTQEQLYTISDGTRQTLADIDEPINVEVYFSKSLGERSAPYRDHFERVKTMLDQYADLAGGRLIVDYYDPEPFSAIEDRAAANGLSGIPTSEQGDLAYFGIVASNSVDDLAVIPFVDIGRDKFLEYDLTSRIHELANPQKSVVGFIPGIGMDGNFEPDSEEEPAWRIMDQIRQFFELEMLVDLNVLPTRLEEIPDGIDILLLAQPLALSEKTVYAIDQYVLGGGKAIVFADPSATIAAGIAYDETLEPLLNAWGIDIDRKMVIADRKNAQRVRMLVDGKPALTNFVLWPSLGPDSISDDDVAVAGIEKLNMATPGAITAIEGRGLRVRPLVQSSDDAMVVSAEDVRHSPNPIQLLRDFEPSGETYDIAVRVSGTASSAFPDGPPDDLSSTEGAERAPHIESGEVNAIVVADIDMLHDRFWVTVQNVAGRERITPTSDNAAFMTNALENLTGQPLLIGLRGRGVDDRPFELVQSIQLNAEREFRDQEKALAEELEKVEARLAALELSGALFLSSEDQQLVVDFRGRAAEVRREMREVRLALRNDIDSLSLWMRLVNIGGVPAALTFMAIGVVGWRQHRRRKKHKIHVEIKP